MIISQRQINPGQSFEPGHFPAPIAAPTDLAAGLNLTDTNGFVTTQHPPIYQWICAQIPRLLTV